MIKEHKSFVLPLINPMTELIQYSMTPQVTFLEYKELRDLQAHPEKYSYYNQLVRDRMRKQMLTQ